MAEKWYDSTERTITIQCDSPISGIIIGDRVILIEDLPNSPAPIFKEDVKCDEDLQ